MEMFDWNAAALTLLPYLPIIGFVIFAFFIVNDDRAGRG